MASFWPMLCRIVEIIEGSLGLLINLIVLFLLFRHQFSSSAFTYLISIAVTALQGAIQSTVIVLIANFIHLFHGNQYIFVFFGATVGMGKTVNGYIMAYAVFSAFCMWELVPASCILQYLALCRPQYSNTKRLIIAYGVCMMMMMWTLPFCSSFEPNDEDFDTFESTIVEVFELNDTDVFDFKGTMLTGGKVSMFYMATLGIFPTYVLSYLIFIYCIISVYRELTAFRITLSKRTALLQRRFLTMLIVQAVTPLVIISISAVILFIALFGNTPLDKMTLLLPFSFWTVPAAQGLVSLLFVIRNLKRPSAQNAQESTNNAKKKSDK